MSLDRQHGRSGHFSKAPVRALGRWLYRLFAVIGLITIVVISTPIVSWWIQAYSGPIQRPRGDILILLSAAPDDNGGISYSSYWRARYAVLAWQTGDFKKIVIAGEGCPEILDFLAAYGVPRQAMIADQLSTSTRENALSAARIIQGIPGNKVLLTSDFHMYRAIRTFRKLGIEVAPMAAPDLSQISRYWYGRFPAFETMLDETCKIAYYRLHGWI